MMSRYEPKISSGVYDNRYLLYSGVRCELYNGYIAGLQTSTAIPDWPGQWP